MMTMIDLFCHWVSIRDERYLTRRYPLVER